VCLTNLCIGSENMYMGVFFGPILITIYELFSLKNAKKHLKCCIIKMMVIVEYWLVMMMKLRANIVMAIFFILTPIKKFNKKTCQLNI
jgi:hypothetical protein